MSQAPSVAFAAIHEDTLVGAPANLSGTFPDGSSVPTREAGSDREAGQVSEGDRHKENVSLRGTTRGLEILISGTPSTAALGTRLAELLAEAPSFFAGSSARVAIEGALPSGALACLEDVATRFQVQIIEIGPVVARRRRPRVPPVLRPDDVPQVHLAEGTGPIADEAVERRGCESDYANTALPALLTDVASSNAVSSNAAPSDAAPTVTAPVAATQGDAAPTVTAPVAATQGDAAPTVTAPVAAVSGDVAPDVNPPVNAAPTEVALADTAAAAAPSAAAPSAATPVAATPVAAAPSAATPVAAAPSAATPVAAAPSAVSAAAAPVAVEPTHVAPTHAQCNALASAAAALADAAPPGPRLVIGPVRSGVIVDHTGHVIVIGDVNPGAEVRAEGSIIVLGRLRGVAHAAIGREAGCIIALSLQPQQLRIGRMVARAGDADRPSDGAEIAYATGEAIVVERFLGRLPSGLAASM